ncbi:hypothetical protein DDE83_009169 [Stemphylium lycopersici]|uniref:Uncharacterized protein n=1 Tax=Stemphylium lycopersici TaxID=183478 RepID=A0A364MR86_STELY|nr:hypothetical protein DDE83_009169 [Stemphylium lycopersici]
MSIGTNTIRAEVEAEHTVVPEDTGISYVQTRD